MSNWNGLYASPNIGSPVADLAKPLLSMPVPSFGSLRGCVMRPADAREAAISDNRSIRTVGKARLLTCRGQIVLGNAPLKPNSNKPSLRGSQLCL